MAYQRFGHNDQCVNCSLASPAVATPHTPNASVVLHVGGARPQVGGPHVRMKTVCSSTSKLALAEFCACVCCVLPYSPFVLQGAGKNATGPAPSGGRRRLAGTHRKLTLLDFDGDDREADNDHDHDDEDQDDEDRRRENSIMMLIRPPRTKHDGPMATSQTQFLTKLCPASGNAAYDNVVDSAGNPLYGQLVVDNGLCGAGNATNSSVVSDGVNFKGPKAKGLNACTTCSTLSAD